jgi:hypothetical protein
MGAAGGAGGAPHASSSIVVASRTSGGRIAEV